ncbi:TPA: hypothetical protein DIV48_03870 [Candidatus Kaiserbacteria bacterium]|nr:MAG: hypothetical protein UY93_C0004G0050 [Parcubacteria group bacterium GW2011_GWA1_56_13]KKW47023.1 MAG: hypothetical protein UY97_C0001G0080 [Parcubacteria group bacterium GW2011_GWB1_57_6]HCR52746.1 hypothetical protein [Candidatus Kaiserbacteria bacterium]
MKESLHLLAGFFLCVVALSGYGYWYTAIANKSIAVADLQNRITAKTETAGRIASARSALAEIAGDEAAVQDYFVPETGVVSFINDLEARASKQKAAMKVLSVSVEGVPTKPTLVLSLAIDGTFDAVMRTVGAIEYAPYDLSVSKLSVRWNEKNTWSATLEITVGSVPATASSTQRTP